MSMNFSREQSLLRQRLQAAGSPEAAQQQQLLLGGEVTHLGADGAVAAATADLAATHPGMGRAQMTAFVRTLWQTKVHELRAVGVGLLAAREALLEAADLPFLEQLVGQCDVAALLPTLAGDVLGPLVARNKKLWRDLKRWASADSRRLQTAAVHASRRPLLDDDGAFARFADLAAPLLAGAETELLATIDGVLAAVAEVHSEAVLAFAAQHGRTIKLSRRKAAAKPKVEKLVAVQASVPFASPAAAPAAAAPRAAKQAAAKKPAATKPAVKKPAAKKPMAKKAGGAKKAARRTAR